MLASSTSLHQGNSSFSQRWVEWASSLLPSSYASIPIFFPSLTFLVSHQLSRKFIWTPQRRLPYPLRWDPFLQNSCDWLWSQCSHSLFPFEWRRCFQLYRPDGSTISWGRRWVDEPAQLWPLLFSLESGDISLLSLMWKLFCPEIRCWVGIHFP